MTIPLAFDVGGEDCGIAFSFTLVVYYALMSTVRLLSRGTKLSIVGWLLYYSQHIIIPSLLILHLSLSSEANKGQAAAIKALDDVRPWRFLLKHATPVFAVLEGFCTVLVIQYSGRKMRALTRRSESWMFVQLVLAAVMLTIHLYFLYRIYTFPITFALTTATLIGAVLTIATSIGLYGILSGRGTAIESSALFGYIVYCLYVTYTDFQSSAATSSLFPFSGGARTVSTAVSAATSEPPSAFSFEFLRFGIFGNAGPLNETVAASATARGLPPLPPIIVNGWANLMATLAELIPQGFVTVFNFVVATISAITPSVAVSLVYRLGVFYLALRIVPSVGSSLRRSPRATRAALAREHPVLFLLYSYAPCIIITVYTHLLMQHFAMFDVVEQAPQAPFDLPSFASAVIWANTRESWQFWGWVNMFTTLAIYGLELGHGTESADLAYDHYKKD